MPLAFSWGTAVYNEGLKFYVKMLLVFMTDASRIIGFMQFLYGTCTFWQRMLVV